MPSLLFFSPLISVVYVKLSGLVLVYFSSENVFQAFSLRLFLKYWSIIVLMVTIVGGILMVSLMKWKIYSATSTNLFLKAKSINLLKNMSEGLSWKTPSLRISVISWYQSESLLSMAYRKSMSHIFWAVFSHSSLTKSLGVVSCCLSISQHSAGNYQ